jgi:hypothetical protein
MLLGVPGATIALVTPPARLTEMALARGLIAGATSIEALNGESLAVTSLVALTASTSSRPIREKPATIPGVTHLPVASTRWAPAGTATPRPAATIRPSRTRTVPPSIGSDPSPSAMVPPVIAIVCAKAGAARSEAPSSADLRIGPRRFTSRPLRRAGRARNR